ncbi:disulfide bond formation protein DsbA [Salmonella enterica]|nr:disulfide bond formation protein DsbA [Salmonella enterica]
MLKRFFLALCSLSIVLSGYSFATQSEEGKEYIKLAAPVKGAPAAVEFFSFYCPPCAAFAGRYNIPQAVNKIMPIGTTVVKYHVSSMGPLGEELTDAWSVARILGVESQVEIPLFKAVQETRSIKSKADIRQVFIDAGIPAEQYDSAINSMVVRSLTAKQNQAVNEFGVTGTPAFYVNGRYLVKNNGIQSTTDEEYALHFADVVQYLLGEVAH